MDVARRGCRPVSEALRQVQDSPGRRYHGKREGARKTDDDDNNDSGQGLTEGGFECEPGPMSMSMSMSVSMSKD